jgi:hypothetical protein
VENRHPWKLIRTGVAIGGVVASSRRVPSLRSPSPALRLVADPRPIQVSGPGSNTERTSRLFGIDYRQSLTDIIALNTDVSEGSIQADVLTVPTLHRTRRPSLLRRSDARLGWFPGISQPRAVHYLP